MRESKEGQARFKDEATNVVPPITSMPFWNPTSKWHSTIFLQNRFGIDGDRIKLSIRLRNSRNSESITSSGMVYALR
jgi:hypothetical protein